MVLFLSIIRLTLFFVRLLSAVLNAETPWGGRLLCIVDGVNLDRLAGSARQGCKQK